MWSRLEILGKKGNESSSPARRCATEASHSALHSAAIGDAELYDLIEGVGLFQQLTAATLKHNHTQSAIAQSSREQQTRDTSAAA